MTQRRCSIPGCTTILSDYNPGPRCFAHEERQLIKGGGVFKVQRITPIADDLSDEEAARYRRMDWASEYRG